jgi:hypothetical protein
MCGLVTHPSVNAVFSCSRHNRLAEIKSAIYETGVVSDSVQLSQILVFVNGVIVGSCEWDEANKEKLNTLMAVAWRIKRRAGLHDVSFYYNHLLKSVFVNTDAGRILKPIVVREIVHRVDRFEQLLCDGNVVLIDSNEQEMYKLSQTDLLSWNRVTPHGVVSPN